MSATISIRPAHPADLPQIHAIFAHYVSNTVLTLMMPPLSPDWVSARFHAVTQVEQMPYLVAVGTPPGQGRPEGPIVGFAYTGGTHMHAYNHTTQLSIFVECGRERRGVGSALMGAVWTELRALNLKLGVGMGAGGEKTVGPPVAGEIRNVLAVMNVDEEGWKGGVGLRDWFVSWGFREVGRTRGVGWKLGRWVDVVTLQLEL